MSKTDDDVTTTAREASNPAFISKNRPDGCPTSQRRRQAHNIQAGTIKRRTSRVHRLRKYITAAELALLGSRPTGLTAVASSSGLVAPTAPLGLISSRTWLPLKLGFCPLISSSRSARRIWSCRSRRSTGVDAPFDVVQLEQRALTVHRQRPLYNDSHPYKGFSSALESSSLVFVILRRVSTTGPSIARFDGIEPRRYESRCVHSARSERTKASDPPSSPSLCLLTSRTPTTMSSSPSSVDVADLSSYPTLLAVLFIGISSNIFSSLFISLIGSLVLRHSLLSATALMCVAAISAGIGSVGHAVWIYKVNPTKVGESEYLPEEGGKREAVKVVIFAPLLTALAGSVGYFIFRLFLALASSPSSPSPYPGLDSLTLSDVLLTGFVGTGTLAIYCGLSFRFLGEGRTVSWMLRNHVVGMNKWAEDMRREEAREAVKDPEGYKDEEQEALLME